MPGRTGFVSAVGHAGTAEVLEKILRQPVAASRARVALVPGDEALVLVLRLLDRLPEGAPLAGKDAGAPSRRSRCRYPGRRSAGILAGEKTTH